MNIFLSYTHADYETALELSEVLENATKSLNIDASIWIDRKNLRISENWFDAVSKEINKSELFVILHSENYSRNLGGFISRERNMMLDLLNQKNISRSLLIISRDATYIDGPLSFFHCLRHDTPDLTAQLTNFLVENFNRTSVPNLKKSIEKIDLLLKAEQRQEADLETSKVIKYISSQRNHFKLMNKKKQIIQQISDSWEFTGFSICDQKKIWDEIREESISTKFDVFAETVKWKIDGVWCYYPTEYNFDNFIFCKGHLPTYRLADNKNPNWFLSWKRRFVETISNM